MTKSSKSTATIRRRKNRPIAELLSKVRKSQPKRTALNSTEGNEVFIYKEVLRSSVIEKIMSSDKTIFLGLIVIRLVNSMLMQTFFVPDEYWQSVEVAHKMIFNYGYTTWEWKVGIRSYAYPLLFATLYKLLEILGLDNRQLLIRGPRLVQGIMASVGDLYLFFLSRRLAGSDVAQWTLLCQLLSWFTSYCCTRTLSNSVEMVLVTAALFYFPWPGLIQPKGHTRRFVILAASSVVVRPTAAVIWLLLCSWHLQHSKGGALWPTLRLYITAGLTVLGIATVIDRIWYGKWLLVHWNFLLFNVFSGASSFYGTHPWHWYLTQGLPVTLGVHTLPFIFGAWQAKNKVLLLLLVWKVFVLSFLAHKEFRFLLPVLPLAMHYCGVYFCSTARPPPCKKSSSQNKANPVSGKAVVDDTGSQHEKSKGKNECNGTDTLCQEPKEQLASSSKEESDIPSSELPVKTKEGMVKDSADALQKGEGDVRDSSKLTETVISQENTSKSSAQEEAANKHRARKVQFLVLLLAASNILPLLYLSLIHQRGTIDVMNYLHEAITHNKRTYRGTVVIPDSIEILILMPCHSTPFYSFLHSNVSIRFLTCEPNLDNVANYTDEADIFYQDPARWLKEEYQGAHQKIPTHIVYFSVLQERIKDFLTLGGYSQCAKFFHTHIPEGRIGSHVLVSCR